MKVFGKSQSIRRIEDLRLLTGHGRYVDDIAPPHAYHAAFLRASVAHAEVTALDVAAARTAPGVRLVLTAADLRAAGLRMDMKGKTVTAPDGTRGATPERPLLAGDRLRFVGEPVAMVVAESLVQARDALELIDLRYQELEPHVAPAPGGPAIHPQAPENIAYDWTLGDAAATEAALAAAAHRVSLRLEDNRVIAASMEPRGAWAEFDGERLHVCAGGQGVWELKSQLLRAFGLPEHAIRVTNPDVGGGFGMKAMAYPEYFALAQAARQLEHPVRWMSDRSEAMLSDNGGRDLVTVSELGFDANLRLTAYKVDVVSNLGAYNSQFGQAIQSELFAKVLPGVYDLQTVHLRARGIYTNTTPVDAYRGAGRPEAIYTLERSMDHAARLLGVDPFELRRRNFIAPGAFPYRSASGETYDVGEFARVLDRAHREADVAGFPARRAAARNAGKLRGLGLCYYIEAILGQPDERARVVFNADGTVSLFVGTQSNGQGHETVFAQFLADSTGLPVEAIRVIQGDSDLIAKGGGTGGSRSVTVQTNVTVKLVGEMVAAFSEFLAGEMEVPAADIRFEEGAFRAAGSNRAYTLAEAAALARARANYRLLTHSAEARLPGRSYPNGAHVAEVEIDPETGVLRLDRYTVTDDLGNLLHPMLAEGQVHGGVAQGFGQAVTERVVFDEAGQLLSASFMDYALPRADELPMIRFISVPVPSTQNLLGMKGCGEAGTVGALAAIANAVQDALWDEGVRGVDMPFTPQRVWGWLREARGRS